MTLSPLGLAKSILAGLVDHDAEVLTALVERHRALRLEIKQVEAEMVQRAQELARNQSILDRFEQP